MFGKASGGFRLALPFWHQVNYNILQSGFLDLEKFLLRGQYFWWVVGFCCLPFGSSEQTSANMIFSWEFVPLNLWDVLLEVDIKNLATSAATTVSSADQYDWDLHWALVGTYELWKGCQVEGWPSVAFMSKWSIKTRMTGDGASLGQEVATPIAAQKLLQGILRDLHGDGCDKTLMFPRKKKCVRKCSPTHPYKSPHIHNRRKKKRFQISPSIAFWASHRPPPTNNPQFWGIILGFPHFLRRNTCLQDHPI